jgi:hypothetical protein
MPLIWIEDSDSRSATIVRLGKKASSSYVKSYKVFGTTDDVVLHADINATISGTVWQYPGQPTVQLTAESYSVSYLGDDAWQVQVSYAKDGADDDNQTEPLKRSRSFDTSGGTQHMTQAQGETAYPKSFAFGGTGGQNGVPIAPNQSKAIGVDGDSVAGVDIVVPQLTWTETYDVPSQYVTNTYIKKVAELTGTVNKEAFRSFAAGEVLFLGASGSHEWDEEKGDGPWSLSYKFVASPNAGEGQTIPAIEIGTITGVEKKGHDYLWVRYEDSVTDNTLLKKPKFVYVNKVYRDGSFSGLGIGTT